MGALGSELSLPIPFPSFHPKFSNILVPNFSIGVSKLASLPIFRLDLAY
jgi:hypothetical protein